MSEESDDLQRNGINLIANERWRQIQIEGFGPSRDDAYRRGELMMAAEAYLRAARHVELGIDPPSIGASGYPWPAESWKPSNDPIRNCAIAGALLAAEMDRLIRLEVPT